MRFLARFCLFLALLWGGAAQAQVVLDATGTGAGCPPTCDTHYASPGTSISTTPYTGMTVGSGTSRALIVITTTNVDPGAFIVSTWAAQTITQIVKFCNSPGLEGCAILWGLVAPTSGNQNITFTWTNAVTDLYVSAISFTGVDQTGGATSFPNSTTQIGNGTTTNSITVNSAVGDYTVAAASLAQTATSTNQTQLFSDHSGTVTNGASSYATGASPSVTHSWTLGAADSSTMVGTDIKAAASGCPTTLALLGVGC
jgi:hypothetical protein